MHGYISVLTFNQGLRPLRPSVGPRQNLRFILYSADVVGENQRVQRKIRIVWLDVIARMKTARVMIVSKRSRNLPKKSLEVCKRICSCAQLLHNCYMWVRCISEDIVKKRDCVTVPAGDSLKSLKCTYGKINNRQKSVNFSAFHRAQNGMASRKSSALK